MKGTVKRTDGVIVEFGNGNGQRKYYSTDGGRTFHKNVKLAREAAAKKAQGK